MTSVKPIFAILVQSSDKISPVLDFNRPQNNGIAAPKQDPPTAGNAIGGGHWNGVEPASVRDIGTNQ
jgi:hypothetical protein